MNFYESSCDTHTLAEALTLTARVVSQVREKRNTLPTALTLICSSVLPISLRGAVQDLSYLSMRQMAAAEAILSILTERKPHSSLYHLLIVALALLLDKEQRYPEFTVVNQAVVAVENIKAFSGKGLVNAVLRNFLRRRPELKILLSQTLTTHWNYPLWWIQRLQIDYPQRWEQLLEIGNQEPPLTLRVNQAHCYPEQALAILAQAKITAQQIGPVALKLAKACPVEQIPGFNDGLFSVQDAGAQLAIPLLDIQKGMHVLDACAAPGGKTGHLLEIAAIRITAIENNQRRAQQITENIKRILSYPGASVQVIVGDALETDKWWNGQLFDRILVDAPCSASGIVRRHPDIRWLRRPVDIQKLVKQQRCILKALWPLLIPQGKLLYTTCSLFSDEGENQARWFECHQKDAIRLPAPGQLLPGVKNSNNILCRDFDGFYYALFEKRLN